MEFITISNSEFNINTLYMVEHTWTCMHFVSIAMQLSYILLHMLILLVVVFYNHFFNFAQNLEALNRDMSCKLAMAGKLHAWHLLCFFFFYEAMFDILVPNKLTSK